MKAKKCQSCCKSFTSVSAYKYHIDHKVCEKREKIKIALKSAVHQALQERFKTASKEDILREMTDMVIESKSAITIDNSTTNNITNNNITNNLNVSCVFPQSFSSENMATVLKKHPEILDYGLAHLADAIPHVIEKVHCNPAEFPEFVNIFMNNHRSSDILYFSDKNVTSAPKKLIIQQLKNDAISHFNQYIDINSHKYSAVQRARYEDHFDNVVKSSKEQCQELDCIIRCALINNKQELIDRNLLKK